jgi:hypothetical protein
MKIEFTHSDVKDHFQSARVRSDGHIVEGIWCNTSVHWTVSRKLLNTKEMSFLTGDYDADYECKELS